jgi:glycine C-acetyltransferase
MLGDEDTARDVSSKLFEDNVFATPIVFPMVAKGKARIRVIVSASHSKEDLDKGLAAFSKATAH